MNSKNILTEATNLILVIFMSFSFTYAMTTSLGLPFSAYTVILLIAIVSIACSFALKNKVSLLITGLAAGIPLIMTVIYLLVKGLFYKLIYKIGVFLVWTADFIEGFEKYEPRYGLYILIFLCIVITIFAYIFTIKYFNFYVLLVSGVTIFIVQWMYGFLVSILPFYIYLLFIMVYYFRYIYQGNVQKESNDYLKTYMFNIAVIPVCALILLLVVISPIKSTPIQWKWLDNRINAVYNFFNNTFPSNESFDFFSLSATGFGGSGSRLGGRVNLDKTLVLDVEAPRQVYLKGAVSDFYTGSVWRNTDKQLQQFNFLHDSLRYDFNEMSQGILSESGDKSFDTYFDKEIIKITYKNIKMKTLLLPLKTYRFNIPGKSQNDLFIDSNGILSMKKAEGKDFMYTTETYLPKYSDEGFQNALRKSSRGYIYRKDESILNSYAAFWNEKIITLNPDGMTYFINLDSKALDFEKDARLRELKTTFENLNVIYSKYLQLPETLPDRVKTLASDITSSANNDYDKVKAIEQYLARNYKYTLSPKPASRRKDFVDSFLFEQKEGYCTYFASAMTVMVRSIGIPARYVEGYMLPSNPETGRIFRVTNEQAHAWVEVYFEGYGWLPFEPTAPFVTSFYSSKEATSLAGIGSGMYENPAYLEYLMHLRGYGNSNISLSDTGLPEQKSYAAYILGGSAALILVLFIVTILVNFSRSKIRILKYATMEPREAVLYQFKYYMKVLSLIGYPVKQGETPLEYSTRISCFMIYYMFGYKKENIDQFMDRVKTDSSLLKLSKLDNVMKVFIQARYSKEAISEDDKKLVYGFNEYLNLTAKDNLGTMKYLAYKYILGMI